MACLTHPACQCTTVAAGHRKAAAGQPPRLGHCLHPLQSGLAARQCPGGPRDGAAQDTEACGL
eukprot:9010941-Lingulodinium_polyedra.AAC.1